MRRKLEKNPVHSTAKENCWAGGNLCAEDLPKYAGILLYSKFVVYFYCDAD